MSTPEHFTGRSIDGGATASTDATHIQEIVRRKMAAAELESQRAKSGNVVEEETRVGTRKDGSFGLIKDNVEPKPLKPAMKKREGGELDKKDGQEAKEEEKEEPELKRRVSKIWKSAIVKIRGPAVARGL